MEDYAEELRTPPVSLISLVGVPELHATISTFMHSEQPPVNTLALPDFGKISVVAAKQKETSNSGQPAGIFKRDWLAKHRTRIPAVVAALFSYDHVSGDPAQWLQVCTDLENLKVVTRGRNIKLVVVLVQSTPDADVSEDRILALRKRIEIDSKYLLVFTQNDATELKQSLNRLATIFAELSNAYYREEGRRIRTRIEKKSFGSIELNIRYCFKVAVYAEFRRDWAEALRFYEEGYNVLREVIGTSTRLPPIQRLVEIKAMAEQLHFKVSTLLLHGGKVVEAITWFWKHIASYENLTGLPEVVFLHWEWMSRQFLVFAELLETSSAITQSSTSQKSEKQLTEWEFQPAYFYQSAAHYLRKKKHYLDLALSSLEKSKHLEGANTAESNSESVAPSVYVGQFAHLLEQDEAFVMQPLTDKEYTLYALAEGKRFQDSYEIIALLKKSFESYSNLKSHRVASYCGSQMGREYFLAQDFSNAKQIFDSISGLYRQEGWVTLLWEILGYLRECSRKLGSSRDFIEYSLEMAALPILFGAEVEFSCQREYGPAGPATLSERENIQREVILLLKGEHQSVSNQENSTNLNLTEYQPLCLEIDLISPLRAVLLASVAFHDQAVKPGSSTLLTLSLLSQLPLPVEIDQLDIQFNQSICNFTISKLQQPPLAADSAGHHGPRNEVVPDLTLVTNKWLRLTYDMTSGQSGKLECLSVIVKIGPHFTICCRAESPASMEDLPLWKFEDRVESFPMKDPSLSFSGQKFIQVEEPEPQVEVAFCCSGPALVGENFVIPISITSRGHPVHSGELKINLVDTRGGGLVSPREMEPFSLDSLQVELLKLTGSNEEEDSEVSVDNFKKIQQSFGLLSVPFLDDGASWSCKLEVRWHRPKLVMLYVSLSYSPRKEATEQKVHVHKSLQIEGKTPIALSHRFMMPFRRDPLLLSKIKSSPESDLASLPLNETSILFVSARNCTEVPLRLVSLFLEAEKEATNLSFDVSPSGEVSTDLTLLVPGEEFRWVFSVIPRSVSPKLSVGTVSLNWTREPLDSDPNASGATTKYQIPDVNVEKPPLVVSLECPPHAVLGVPFTFFVRIQNQTHLLQEATYSMADTQSFVSAGSHNGKANILPDSEGILSYKVVPLASGQQQLPRITVVSSRYSAQLQPSLAACTIFVFPTRPHFELSGEEDKGLEAMEAMKLTHVRS